MANNNIDGEEFGEFFKKKYELVCEFLDCEAFQSWHTPSRSEWGEVLAVTRKMVKQHDWPLYAVIHNSEDASSPTSLTNTGLMLNAIHKLLAAFKGHDVKYVPSPGQWGDIMRVVDETAERRALIDETAKPWQ